MAACTLSARGAAAAARSAGAAAARRAQPVCAQGSGVNRARSNLKRDYADEGRDATPMASESADDVDETGVELSLRVHGDHVDVTEAMNAYAEKKLQNAVGPFTDLLRYADVRLTVHGGNAGKGRREHKAEVTVHTKGRGIIRAEVRHEDMYASIDKAADKIQRQTRKLKERVKVKQGGVRTADVGAVGEDESFDDAPLALAHEPELPEEVARTKYFSLSPMSQADALQQLEYSDHDFWVYMDDRSQKIQVLYKRKAGGVGNLVPIMPEAENEA